MPSLTNCIKKAGGHLRSEDKAAILARAAVLRAGGAKNAEASLQAVQERIADVSALLEAASPPKAGDTAPKSRQNRVEEPGVPYETDLFGERIDLFGGVPGDARRAAPGRPAAAARGDVQPAPAVLGDTPAPAGEYAVRTIVGREVERHLGAARILTAADAAAATRYLYKSAVERFDGIVIDKDGKPIAVVGGFKGAPTQAAIYASTLIGELVRVPGAAGVWFSHNHPSGLSVLSRADEHLFGLLVDSLRGSGIEPKGLLAVGDGTYSAALPGTLPGMPGDVVSQPIPAPKAGVRVPVIERELVPATEALPEISSPAHAKDIAAKYYGQAKAPGFVLLDGQNFVAAWVPLPVSAMGELRGTGGLNAIYRAVSESNAVAAVLVHGGELDARMPGRGSLTVGENIGAALDKMEVRVLDSIDAKNNISAAQTGADLKRGPVFSRVTPQEKAAMGNLFGEQEREQADAEVAWFELGGRRAEPPLLASQTPEDLKAKAEREAAGKTREDEAGNVALFSRADSPATEGTWQPAEEQSEKVQSLNTALVNYGLGESWRSAYEPAAVPDSLPGFRKAVQAALGRDVQFVAPTAPSFNIFNGVYIDEAPGTVFVNARSKHGLVQVTLHEIWHDLRRSRPDLYRWFRSVAQPYWRDTEVFRSKLNALLQAGEAPYSEGQALEELEANFLGDSFTDRKFLQALADDSPRKFKQLVDVVLDWLNRVLAALRPGLGSDAYVGDVEALQGYLRQVLVAFAEGKAIPAGPPLGQTSRAAFNRQRTEPFFSALARSIDDLKSAAAPAAGWRDAIRGLVAKGAVKQDEVEWTGVNEWLAMQQGKVTKADVLDYLRGNGVRVTETVLGSAPNEDRVRSDYMRAMVAQGATASEADQMFREMLAFAHDRGHNEKLKDRGFDLVMRDGSLTGNEILDMVAGGGDTKHAQYTLPGGTNYREVLLTLPDKAEEYGDYLSRTGKKDSDQARADYYADVRRKKPEYRSNHWDQHNVLAHIRLNDRTDTDGKRVLFVEEIQSDHAQDAKKRRGEQVKALARERGITEEEADKEVPRLAGFREAQEAEMLRLVAERDAATDDAEAERIQAKINRLGAAAPGVPLAPFVDATDKWVTLALKRIIKMAVDEGYDRVAFVTGEQSEERYDLSKQIAELRYHPETEHLRAYKNRGDTEPVIDRQASPQELPDIVGKEIADRLLNNPSEIDDNGVNRLRGLDLKVGGEGMRAFYDSIVPKVAKDVLRKMGGRQMGAVSIERTTFGARGRPLDWDVRDGVFSDQPGFDITPAMREKAAGGLPLFARAPATDTPAFRRWFGDSKVVDAQGKPLPMYHGTAEDFSVFKPKQAGAIFFTDNPNFAEAFSVTSSEWMRERGLSPGQNLMPVYVKAESPFDTRKPEHVSAFTKKALELYGHTNGDGRRVVKPGTAPSLMSSEVLGEMLRNDFSNWFTVESDWGQKVIRSLGHDGFYVMEAGQRNLAVFEPTQVKSATGNHGTFDPGNPDIRFSRAEPAATTTTVQTASGSMTTETRRSAWLDATNRIQFAPGQWLYSAIGRAASPLLTKLGLKAASPEMRRLLRQMKLDVAKAQETAGAVAKDMLALDLGEREMVSDIIEKELKAGIAPPEHAVRLAAVMNQAMGAQARELVRLGMLSEEVAKRWDGAYLPRFYESKLRPKVDAWADAVRKLIGRTPVMPGIKGKHLKGRGLYETVPVRDLEQWQRMGWEVRDPDYDPNPAQASMLPPDGTVQVWRDFSREERDRMGEIRDAGFRFVMGYMQTQRDIAVGRLFEALASDERFSSRTQRESWVRVPDSTVEGTGAKKYGKLAGRFVPPDVLSQLTALDEAQSEAWQFYRKAMGIWKLGKTSMNPVSHMNNVLSNLSMAHFAGVSYHRADKYFGALRDFITKPAMLQEAKDAGLFLGTMNAEELLKDLPPALRDMATKAESKTLRGARLTFDLLTFFLRKPLGKAYEAEDLYFRYLIYKDARQRGMEPQDAVDHAQRFIFTYDDLPKGARMIRDFGIPFFAYTYKAIPALLHTALTHPHRMLAPAAVLWGANALAYALATDDDDDWQEAIRKFVTDAEFRERVREKQKAEHEHLPPWMKGMTALLTPKAIRLGMDEVTELPLFIDVSRIIPGGDIFDVSPNAGGIPLPQPITPSHPLLSIATAMIANKDLWTGKDLVLKDADTSAEAAEKRAAWLWKQVSPSIAVGNYHWERTLNALAQATGSEVRVTWPLPDDIAARIPEAVAKTYTGTDRGGMPVQPGLAALQTVGIKVRPIDLDLAEKIDASNRQRLIRDIDAQLRTMRRLNGKMAVSDKALDEAIETANRKKDRLREGLTVDGNNRD